MDSTPITTPRPPPNHPDPLDPPQTDSPTTEPLSTVALRETATTTTDAVTSSESPNTTNNTNILPLVLAPILVVFGLGGLFFLWHHFSKRRKARHVAPSAEFQKYRRRSVPLADVEGGGAAGATAAEGTMAFDGRRALHAYQNDGGAKSQGANTDLPPLFAPGLFKDPIFEKGVAISLANQSGSGRHDRLRNSYSGGR
jgi:hypothetical protein